MAEETMQTIATQQARSANQGRASTLTPTRSRGALNPYEQREQARAALQQAEADFAQAKAHYESTGSRTALVALCRAEAVAARAWHESDAAEGLVVDTARAQSAHAGRA